MDEAWVNSQMGPYWVSEGPVVLLALAVQVGSWHPSDGIEQVAMAVGAVLDSVLMPL